MLNKGSSRKFTGVNVTKIVKTPGSKTQSYNMGAVPFKPQSFGGPGGVEALELNEKIKKLEKELKQARGEIEKVKISAAQELDLAKIMATEEGQKKGREEAEREFKQEYEKSLANLSNGIQSSLQKIAKEKKRVFIQWEKDVMDIVLSSIEKILNLEISENKKHWAPLIKNAIQSLGHSNSITLKVHPQNFNSISDNKNLWLPLNGSFEEVKIEADERIQAFSCIIDSGKTSVEVSLEKILLGLSKSFEDVYLSRKLEVEEEIAAKPVALPNTGAIQEPSSELHKEKNQPAEQLEKVAPTEQEGDVKVLPSANAPSEVPAPKPKNKFLDVDLNKAPIEKPKNDAGEE